MYLFLRPYRAKVTLERPLRGEMLSKDLLASRAAELAQFHSHVQVGGRGARLRQRFRENTRILNEAYFSFAESSRNKEMLAAGAEWLLDNFHVIDEQVRDIRRDLPKSYYQALPKLTSTEWKGYPRVYQIVCDFISHTDSIVETESLTTFIKAYQTNTILSIGEIWAVPIMLRLALVENLRRLAQNGLLLTQHRREAERVCRDTLDQSTLAGADLLIQLVNRVNQNPGVLDYGAAQILRRLRAKGAPASLSMQWLDEQLRDRGIDPNEVNRLEQKTQAADQISVGNAVTALKTIGSLNWRDWFERVSEVDLILAKDPANVYHTSDFITRDMYRHRIERLAQRARVPEVEIARAAIQFAKDEGARSDSFGDSDPRYKHVGYYLIDDGLKAFQRSLDVRNLLHHRVLQFIKRNILGFYLGSIGFFTVLGVVLATRYSFANGGGFLWLLVILFLFPFPLSELSIHVVHWLATKFVRPRALPKLNYEEGVSPKAKTAIVIQTILGDREALEHTVENLQIRAIGNFDDQICYGILADFVDSPNETLAGDIGLVHRAEELIGELNERHCPNGPQRFFIMFRRRLWNPSEGKFMGWERKRGKIMEFNRFVRGADDTTLQLVAGDLGLIREVKYVITLDNDTRLPPGVARKLIGAIDHPLNRPIFDERSRMIKKGYALIQPRVGITLQSANASRYAAVVSGHTGLDPYTLTVSDVYQDLFSEGSYIGKGIYDVAAFEHALENRFPENALLSHDLIEGLFARCGLASDIEVFDDFPQRYHAQARRQHRWIRGDWQLLPWLGRSVPDATRRQYPSPFSGLGWWKLFDNFRRSLVPPAMFFGLIFMWAFAPGSQLVWLTAFAAILSFPVLTVAWRLLFDLPIGYSFSTFLFSLYTDLSKNLQLIFLNLLVLPHHAASNLDAILITLYRVLFGKKHLLEWETAHAAERRLGGKPRDFFRAMTSGYWLLLFGLVVVYGAGVRERTMIPAIFFVLWAVSPVLAWWMSRTTKTSTERLAPQDREYLRSVAFSTWQYFDSFLIPEYNFLIPDNLQIVPQRVVAERTSPTNISLSVLSVMSAYDLGFIPITGVIRRLSSTFHALDKLERFHGHFLNWYGIRDLRALNPRYISTVDSGNMVGHFIAVRETLRLYPLSPMLTEDHIRHVALLLRKTKAASEERIAELFREAGDLSSLVELTRALVAVNTIRSELAPSAPVDLTRVLDEILELEPLLTWVMHLEVLKKLGERELLPKKVKNIEGILQGRTPTLSLLSKIVARLRKVEDAVDRTKLTPDENEEFGRLLEALGDTSERLAAIDQAMGTLHSQLERFISEADFKFLFDAQKKLFIIGYNIDNGHRDNSFYDLLASEARLASIVAIAKGDVPQSHWFLLNRALTDSPGGKALISWGGTMFEYLMPLLVTKNFPFTLLSETYRAVVKAQRLYGLRRGIPWGISESAYSGVDFEKTYQYRAFGIPGLGLKRGLAEDLVVSPYSTVMALAVEPRTSIENLRRLEREGVRGEFGFYEAVDYTPERLGVEERSHIVKSFLAHHQGMSLVSINNLLNNDVFPERFHADPAIKSCELLLQERFPTRIPVIQPHQAEVLSLKTVDSEGRSESSEIFRTPHTRYPYTRVISNRTYSVIVDNAGTGGSFFRTDVALTRFRDDGLSNNTGTFAYIRDLDSGALWSTAYQPTKVEPEFYEAIFGLDKVEFKRRDRGMSTLTEITVSPEDNVEVRRITLTNLSGRLRRLELTSFGEVALAPVRADSAHPAFSKMFVFTEYLEEYEALLFHRRPRTEHDKELFMMHLVSMPIVWAPTEYETSREKFIGRGTSLQKPLAFQQRGPLSGTTGTVLDPIFALRNQVEVDAGESQVVCYVTAVAESRDELIQLIRKYREGQHITRAFEMAWSHSDVEIRHQQITRANVQDFQKLANAILYNIESLRAPAEIMRRSRLAQNALWRFGISGDEPIVLLVINDPEQVKLGEELCLAHEYLRLRGVRFDLVILNEYQSGYLQDLQQELEFVIRTGISRNLVEQRGGVYLRSIQQLSEEEMALLQSIARVVIYGNRGSLSSQLNFVQRSGGEAIAKRSDRSRVVSFVEPRREELLFYNGFGGFSPDGQSYQLSVRGDNLPPAPWANVIANPAFGFVVTESGSGYTWADNSRENRLTSWTNDPLSDPASEAVYIRDQESGEYWCPTPRPVPLGHAVNVTHGFGYSSFRSEVNQLRSELVVSGAPSDPVKWWYLELENRDSKPRKIEIFLYVEWVLGVSRQDTYRHLRTGYDAEKQIVYVSNPFNIDFSNQVAFVGSNLQVHSQTTNRREFIGRLRDPSQPAAFDQANLPNALGQRLVGGKGSSVVLSGTTGGGLDSCAALKVQLNLLPNERHHVLFYLAKAADLNEAKERSIQYRSISRRSSALKEVSDFWSSTTSAVEVSTPNKGLDILTNGWLEYQTLACRMFARSGFYQSSGAIGFRDQLQDSMAFLISRPSIAKEQILLHASRQFPEGDVQHWWHPPSGRGIRSRITDNFLWLPYVVNQFVEITGDTGILDEQVPFIEGPQLEPNIHDSYFTPTISTRKASLYEHCLLALDRGMTAGPHGIPLIGGGDWNDGMNNVGLEGKGESIWLGWFTAHILKEFSAIVEARGDLSRAERYRSKAQEMAKNIEEGAWDGHWYRRAYFDDGTPIGSNLNGECQIDAIAQSWSIISGLGDPERRHRALEQVNARLVDREARLVKLLWPPFESSQPNPGYIQSYPAGLRENGGQYTHAAAWTVLAAAVAGEGDLAGELFDMINPITHTDTPQKVQRYKTEPYVTCGDVYSNPQHVGRGGWSWYTGSSGWIYRVAVEHILGLKVTGERFTLSPCIPRSWPEYRMTFRYRGNVYRIVVKNPKQVSTGVSKMTIDGKELVEQVISIADYPGEHDVEIELG